MLNSNPEDIIENDIEAPEPQAATLSPEDILENTFLFLEPEKIDRPRWLFLIRILPILSSCSIGQFARSAYDEKMPRLLAYFACFNSILINYGLLGKSTKETTQEIFDIIKKGGFPAHWVENSLRKLELLIKYPYLPNNKENLALSIGVAVASLTAIIAFFQTGIFLEELPDEIPIMDSVPEMLWHFLTTGFSASASITSMITVSIVFYKSIRKMLAKIDEERVNLLTHIAINSFSLLHASYESMLSFVLVQRIFNLEQWMPILIVPSLLHGINNYFYAQDIAYESIRGEKKIFPLLIGSGLVTFYGLSMRGFTLEMTDDVAMYCGADPKKIETPIEIYSYLIGVRDILLNLMSTHDNLLHAKKKLNQLIKKTNQLPGVINQFLSRFTKREEQPTFVEEVVNASINIDENALPDEAVPLLNEHILEEDNMIVAQNPHAYSPRLFHHNSRKESINESSRFRCHIL